MDRERVIYGLVVKAFLKHQPSLRDEGGRWKENVLETVQFIFRARVVGTKLGMASGEPVAFAVMQTPETGGWRASKPAKVLVRPEEGHKFLHHCMYGTWMMPDSKDEEFINILVRAMSAEIGALIRRAAAACQDALDSEYRVKKLREREVRTAAFILKKREDALRQACKDVLAHGWSEDDLVRAFRQHQVEEVLAL